MYVGSCLVTLRGRMWPHVDAGRRGEGGQQAASSSRAIATRRRSTPRATYRRGRGSQVDTIARLGPRLVPKIFPTVPVTSNLSTHA